MRARVIVAVICESCPLSVETVSGLVNKVTVLIQFTGNSDHSTAQWNSLKNKPWREEWEMIAVLLLLLTEKFVCVSVPPEWFTLNQNFYFFLLLFLPWMALTHCNLNTFRTFQKSVLKAINHWILYIRFFLYLFKFMLYLWILHYFSFSTVFDRSQFITEQKGTHVLNLRDNFEWTSNVTCMLEAADNKCMHSPSCTWGFINFTAFNKTELATFEKKPKGLTKIAFSHFTEF